MASYRLHPVLQPRFTWQYITSAAALAYIAYCFISWQPLFSSNMPPTTGPFQVGAVDLEVPVRQPRLINDAIFKETGQPAFKLETVLCALYYPATSKGWKRTPGHYWVDKPLALTAVGYARFAHISNFVTNNLFTGLMGILVGNARIPAMVDAPLIPADAYTTIGSVSIPPPRHDGKQIPMHAEEAVNNSHPVIVFSHGMASTRTQYSHYASELASRGYIVACIEHRDGSGPGTLIMHNQKQTSQARVRPLLHFDLTDLTLPSKTTETLDTAALKRIQLAFRQAEIEEVASLMQRLDAGDGDTVHALNPRLEGATLPSWKNRLDIEHMMLAGHSYGATGALQALRQPQQLFKAGIILDPGKSSGPLEAHIDVPLLIVHSNSWSRKHTIFQGRPHFDVVRDLARSINARGGNAWFMTSLGTSHPSVTDAPLLEPVLLSWTTGSKIEVVEGVRQYVHVSHDFGWWLRTGEKRNLMASRATSERYDDDNKSMDARFRQFWQVHVSPVA